MDLTSTIICPLCGFRKKESMPNNTCVTLYKCGGCGTWLTPEASDCCVFCSYGDVKCLAATEKESSDR